MIELLGLILGFIVLSGILAMIDAAILSVSHAEVEEMVMKQQWGAIALRRVQRRITQAVVVIVITTNTVNVLGPILVGQRAANLYGSDVLGIITAVLAFGTIIFSEIIPKSLGAHYAPRISRLVAPLILSLITVLKPLVIVLEKLASFFQTGRRKIGTEEQIRSLVTIGRRAGHIESDEGQLIHRAFILNDKTAQHIMTPLKDVIAVRIDETIREASGKIFREPYSRYPVIGDSMHEIRGIVMSRDVLQALSEGRDTDPVTDLMRSGLVVPSSIRSDALLARFRDESIHLAVVQEHGKTVGLVTLEDVLEELVGEIEDELDVAD